MSPIPRQEYSARIGDDLKSGSFWRDGFAELLSVFFFVAASTMLANGESLVQFGIGVAFVWAAIGYGLGDFGGAHVSSAVTLAMLVRGEVTIVRGIVYWIMQAGGAIAAIFFAYAMLPEDTDTPPSLMAYKIATGVSMWQAVVMEAVVTLILCLTYLGSQSINRKGYVILQSIPIGMAAGVGGFLAFPFTGACMNPTQAVARAVFQSAMLSDTESVDWSDHWVFWAGPMGGAFLAAIFYWIFDSVDSRSLSGGAYGPYGTWSYANYGARPAKSSSREALTQPSDAGLYPQAF